MKIVDSSVDLPKDHLHISIHGNVVAKIADALKGLFKGQIRDEITKQINAAIQKELPASVNKMLAD